MIQFFDKIRQPKTVGSKKVEIKMCIAIALFAGLLGVFQKYLDSTCVNTLPYIIQAVDLGNFFGRFAIWILFGIVLSVYAFSPKQAALHTFIFFVSMVSGYYLYCNCVLGFLPVNYMKIWFVMAFISPVFSYICWYAKGEGMVAVMISSVILGVVFSQAFLITQGFYMTHVLEVVMWMLALLILRRKPKDFMILMIASLVVAYVYQLFVPYWG